MTGGELSFERWASDGGELSNERPRSRYRELPIERRARSGTGDRSTGKLSFEGKPASQQSQAEVKFRGAGAVAKRVYSQSRAVDTVQAYVWCLAKPIRTA